MGGVLELRHVEPRKLRYPAEPVANGLLVNMEKLRDF